jgi:hypothetical protein
MKRTAPMMTRQIWLALNAIPVFVFAAMGQTATIDSVVNRVRPVYAAVSTFKADAEIYEHI